MEEGKTHQKAEDLMDKFKGVLSSNQEVDETKQLKNRISSYQDEILALKDQILVLKNQNQRISTISDETPSEEAINVIEEEIKNDSIQDPVQLALKQELKEYESMLEIKDKEVKDGHKKYEQSQAIIDSLNNDLQKSRKNAQELLKLKDKEIEKLKSMKKKIEDQYNSLSIAFNNPVDGHSHSLKNINPEIPQEFFEETSSDGPEEVKITKKPKEGGEKTITVDRKISYTIEEQHKEKVLAMEEKISDLEKLIKYHMTREQDMVDKVNDLQRCKTREGVNIEYIKNVYVSYLEYKAMKNDNESKTCEQVLFTALRLSPQEIKEIDRLRKKYKNYKFWKLIPQSSSSKKKKEKEMQILLANTARVHQQDQKDMETK